VIFDELVLHNFGIYRGEHKVALTPFPGRPIVLLGALNGSGKTTFLEAMQLALYGKGAKSSSRGRLAYQDYLLRSINRYVEPSVGAGLQFEFRHLTEGREERIRLFRTWVPSDKGVKEVFEVWRNGVFDSVATERWAEFVEDFIPSQISDLFFFDGEKIESLADPEQSAALLKVGFHSLLGLDLVDQLVRSLGIIERRRKTAQLAVPDRAAIEQLDKEIEALEQKKGDLAQQSGELTNAIGRGERAAATLEKQLETSGGQLLLRRRELEGDFQALKNHQALLTGQLIEMVGGDAPLLLVGDLLAELEASSTQNLAATMGPEVTGFIQQRDKRLVEKLGGLGVRSQHVEAIEEFLRQSRPDSTGGAKGEPAVAIPPAKLFAQSEREEVAKSLTEKLAEFERAVKSLENVERNLAAIPQKETVKEIVQALEKARLERERLSIRKELLEEEYRKTGVELERKLAQRRTRLEELAEQTLAVATTQRVLKHSARSRATLGKYRDEIAKSHMVRLEGLITECFGQLHRKRQLKHTVAIDRETYELRLTEDGGKRVSASELSAGERQLLAVSVLWALARASGRRLPTVIDTPLGRLDSKHRHYLVENYFPQASHQVILFSTDEEIISEYYHQLRPVIGRQYCIVFDEEKRSSNVLEGYFSEEALAA
jgi:DNA sulfur modification protein DndD